MSNYKAIVEKHSCKPNQGCGTATTCMCGLAEDMADEIERLRKELKSLVDWEEPLHRILRLSDGDFSYLEADFAKARAALGEGKE